MECDWLHTDLPCLPMNERRMRLYSDVEDVMDLRDQGIVTYEQMLDLIASLIDKYKSEEKRQ